MMEKITAFFKQYWPGAANAPLAVAAAVLAVALVVAFLSLWLAKITGVSDGFLRLVDSVLSPTVAAVGVIAGVVIWLFQNFDVEVRELFYRIRELPGGMKLSPSEKNAIPSSDKAEKEKELEELFSIGWKHDSGDGIPKNHTEAAKWYRRAAEQGHGFAQLNLGSLYLKGEGVPQSNRDAYVWYSLATISGVPFSRQHREQVAKRLSNDILAEAQAEAGKYFAEIQRKQGKSGK